MHSLTDQACRTAADEPVSGLHYHLSLSYVPLQTSKTLAAKAVQGYTVWALLLCDVAADQSVQ